jgi:tetratricopeptide (TPR) repeat protein
LNPNYANAHHFYALYLTEMGRFDEVIAEIKRTQELEPSSLFIHANGGAILYHARRYDEAIVQLKRVLELNPNFDHARAILTCVYLQKGMYEQAIIELKKRTITPTFHSDLGQAYALSGRRSEALKEIATLKELSKQHYVAPYTLALVYASLDDKDNALEWLVKAYEDRSTLLIWIRVEPRLDKLRSDPRFKAVLKRMGA